jgi:hypothetical protein
MEYAAPGGRRRRGGEANIKAKLLFLYITLRHIYRVSRGECARLRENVP